MGSAGSNDPHPLEHILVKVSNGRHDDRTEHMLGLVRVAIDIGRRHRAPGATITRYAFPHQMYRWVGESCLGQCERQRPAHRIARVWN